MSRIPIALVGIAALMIVLSPGCEGGAGRDGSAPDRGAEGTGGEDGTTRADSIGGVEAAGHRVLLVENWRHPGSARIADRYATIRRVPTSHRIEIEPGEEETVSRKRFDASIVSPLVEWWRECPPEARPDFLVLTRGIPIRVSGSDGRAGDLASVDSELTLLPRLAEGKAIELRGPLRNPYFRPPGVSDPPPFSAEKMGICLVTRLDGYEDGDALDLIRLGISPGEARGRFLFDLRGGPDDAGERALERAARRLRGIGEAVILDTTTIFVGAADSLLGYASWGSNDLAYDRTMQLRWLPGGIATTFVSSSARTFVEPSPDWRPGRQRERERHHQGSPQSLIGDLLRTGATGAAGNVDEPYLDGCVRPDVLFPAYLAGRTLAESFYLAMPYLSWRGLVVGDPLCRIRSERIGRSRP